MTICRTIPQSFDLEIPLLIVGAGACGLTAALAAADAGADVLVVERDAQPFGSTGMSYGAICAAGSKAQRAVGIDDCPADLLEDILAITAGKTDPALAQLLADHAAGTVDWLSAAHGLDLTVETAWQGFGHRVARLHAPPDRSGLTLMNQLQTACTNAGIDILCDAQVTRLFADDSDRVRGAEIQRPDGALETVGCRAIIIATCGFGANRSMVSEYIPELKSARYYGHEGNEGDGILWGMQLGGDVADMGSFQALGSLAEPQALVIPHTLMIGGGIQVNVRGERFEDELEDISGQALTILQQPDNVCWIVYDQRLHEQAIGKFREYQQASEYNVPKIANDIASLAQAMQVSADALRATLEEHTTLCATETSDKFGRLFKREHKLAAPYYAIRVTGALFHTQGGLRINQQARVINHQDQPLPNVFAGGGAARSVSGPGGSAYMPAMGLCTAVTLGRLAGTHAAELSSQSQ